MIQATCIPPVKVTWVLNTLYYPITDKTSDTNLTVYIGQDRVAPLNHQHITELDAMYYKNHTVNFRHGLMAPLIHQSIL